MIHHHDKEKGAFAPSQANAPFYCAARLSVVVSHLKCERCSFFRSAHHNGIAYAQTV